MHRCYIEARYWAESAITPSAQEAHHLKHVLRVRDGETVRVFDGAGGETEAVVRIPSGDGPLTLTPIAPLTRAAPALTLTLAPAVLKSARMDLLIEKATELGVTRIVPVLTRRSIPRLDPTQSQQKQDRWMRIAVSAAKQCGTRWLPDIESPQPWETALPRLAGDGGRLLLASLAASARPLAVVTDALRATPPASVTLLVGPEGDFTPEETAAALDAGAWAVSLGALILRAETASMALVSVLACMLGPSPPAQATSA